MLVCSRYIPKVCSGAVCARLFTASAGEEKAKEVIEVFARYRKEENVLINRLKDTGISRFQAGIAKFAEDGRFCRIGGGAIYLGTCLTLGEITYKPFFDLVDSLSDSTGIELISFAGRSALLGACIFSGFRVTNFVMNRIPVTHSNYREIESNLAVCRDQIRSVRFKAEDIAIGSPVPDLFD